MKHILIILLIPLSAMGQEYLPFPLESAKWTNGYYLLNTDNPNFYFFELYDTEVFETSTDTIISGTTYTKIISNSINQPYAGSLREIEGKVFIVPPDSVSELILYDFTLNIGDTIEAYSENFSVPLVVEDTYYLEIDGSSRKVIQFEGGNWIEGVGANRGLFMEVLVNISGGWSHLECFEIEGWPIFSADGSDQGCILSSSYDSTIEDAFIFPNPSSGEIQSQGIDGIISYQLINTTGRLVKEARSISKMDLNFTEEAKGIYLL
ncbi:MAG TPA: hypothetical protein VJ911_00505, partial [Cryomorphaceae bacterium]|nr:hypothetical protein [Cryomorphaceae bacterium]